MPLLGKHHDAKGHGRIDFEKIDRFEHDIFISYAHIDNETFLENEKGWIAKLHRALELRVGQLHGRAPKIWRDPRLQGNDTFADRLDAEVPKTALLVSVLSPRYLRSDWCQREFESFIAASERSGGLRFADKSRVFKVIKTPIPVEKQPAMMQKMLGYEFYLRDSETGRPSELTPDDPAIQRHYWSRLDDLAYDICQMLELLEATDGESPAPTEIDEAECIYLASTSVDLKDQRDALRRDLMLRGYRVLPEEPLPLVASELVSAVKAQISRCRLSIHPVGRGFGVVPEGATDSGPAIESGLARNRCDAGGDFARLVWMPPDLETYDERQQALIDDLRADPRPNSSADLLECSLESLKTEVRLRLETPPPEVEPPRSGPLEVAPDDELKQIYLIHDQRDEEVVEEIEEALFDRGFEVIASSFEGDEAQIRQEHQESLCECDAVLLYYGAGSDPWLRRKLREVRKSAAFGRRQPLLGTAVYVAPPTTARKARLKIHETMLLDGQEAFEPSQLEPFFAWLQPAQGGSAS